MKEYEIFQFKEIKNLDIKIHYSKVNLMLSCMDLLNQKRKYQTVIHLYEIDCFSVFKIIDKLAYVK